MAAKKPEPSSSGITGLELIVFVILLTAIIPIIAGFFVSTFKPLEILLNIREYFTPFFEKYLIWLEVISVMLSIFFIWGVGHAMKITNYFIDARGEDVLDFLGKDYKFKLRIFLRWRSIKKNLESADSKKWKTAILDAENILNDIFKDAGYLGSKLDAKLDLLAPEQIPNIEDIKRAVHVRREFMADPTLELTPEQAREVIEIYKKTFVEMNLIKK